jgi:hypothetical protein
LIALVDEERAVACKKRTYFLIGEARESRIEVPIITHIQNKGPEGLIIGARSGQPQSAATMLSK